MQWVKIGTFPSTSGAIVTCHSTTLPVTTVPCSTSTAGDINGEQFHNTTTHIYISVITSECSAATKQTTSNI